MSGAGGGGGGASGIPAGATGVSGFSLVPTTTGAEPLVTFSWAVPPPTAVTGPASAITQTSATLNGTVNPNDSPLTDCHFTVSPTPPAGASLPCAQQVALGGTPVPVSGQLFGLSPSTTYTVTLVAANAIGPASGSPVAFTTLSVSQKPPPPIVSGLAVAARIHRGKLAATIARRHTAKPPRPEPTISLRVSEASRLVFTFQHVSAGRVVRGACVPVTLKLRHAKSCTRFTRVTHRLSLTAHAGVDKIKFDGVLDRGFRLALGSYRLTVVATNAAGRASRPFVATFVLVK